MDGSIEYQPHHIFVAFPHFGEMVPRPVPLIGVLGVV